MLRFSQSLTHELGLNDLRLALFNFILSKQLNEKLQIRIDDLDVENNIIDNDKKILETLSLFSIDYETVLYQSENLKYHQKLAMQLMSQKKAFACFCSDEKISELPRYDGFCSTLSDETVLNCNAPFVVRIKEESNNSKIDSFAILNHNKTATNVYATAVDDMLYDISTVLCNEKQIIDAPKHIYIRELLNYNKEINYVSVPDILNQIDVATLIEEGFLPSTIANYLVAISTDSPIEIFSIEEAISWFDINLISKKLIEFNIEKLKEINKKHLETIDNFRFSKILGFADEDIGKLGKLYIENSSTIKEIKENIDSIFSKKMNLDSFDIEAVKNNIKNMPYFDNFEEFKNYIAEQVNMEDEKLDIVIRHLLTGKQSGPNISSIYSYIKNYIGEIIK